MKRLTPIITILLLTLSACETGGVYVFDASGRTQYSDDDWNLTFYDNCGMPKGDSVRWIEERNNKFIRFQLGDKNYGGCSTDRMRRHGAPYWERAELKQSSTLNWNSNYELEFNVRFVKGFSGDRETFWQMFSSNPGNSGCKTSRPFMLKISRGRLLPALLKAPEGHQKDGSGHYNFPTNLKINDLLGKWSVFKIKFNTFFKPKFDTSKNAKNATVSLFVNDKEIISNAPYGIEKCGTPHFKFGIYRPGNKNGNKLSIIDFDKINVKKIK